jgi:phosphoglycolate phosphatase-like HAD superfamily hydrolase
MGQSVTKAELADIIQRFYALDNQAIENVDDHLFADAIDLARRLHQSGKRQIVTTNRPHGIDRGNGSPRALIQNSCLHEYITDVLCGDDGEYRKPHRQFLEARFGSNLETLGRMIFIGDQFVDAEFARNCDSPAILVARNNTIAHLDRLDTREQRTQIVASLNAIHVADIAPAKQIPDISAMLVDSATNTKTA